MSDIKKPELNERKAFYYFGFNNVVPFNEVNPVINDLREKSADNEELLEKVNSHAANIDSYFDDEELKNDDELLVRFNSQEPRKSWESHKDDFDLDENSQEDEIEPVEEVEEAGDIEPVDEVEDEEEKLI